MCDQANGISCEKTVVRLYRCDPGKGRKRKEGRGKKKARKHCTGTANCWGLGDRWLRCSECCLTWVWFPACTWQLTSICHSISRAFVILQFFPGTARWIVYIHTQAKHPHTLRTISRACKILFPNDNNKSNWRDECQYGRGVFLVCINLLRKGRGAYSCSFRLSVFLVQRPESL